MVDTENPALKVLIVDDEPKMCRALVRALGVDSVADSVGSPLSVETVGNAEEAEVLLEKKPFDVVLTDLRLPGRDGLSLVRHVREKYPETEVILMTAYASVETAVGALRSGAYDYVIKPFNTEEIVHLLARIRERRSLLDENLRLRAEIDDTRAKERLVGEAPSFLRALRMASRVAATDSTVFLRGESGTGKDLFAAEIHRLSPRAKGPFIRATCAAIQEGLLESDLFGHERGSFTGATEARKGKFELADGGTIFLDEVGDMTLSTQVKLLRVIQEREFERVGSSVTRSADVRVIAATNRDLEEAIEQGQFREDLYYRLNVVRVDLPPLRERKEDMLPLVRHFVEKVCRRAKIGTKKVSREVMEILSAHNWPGNVRELENAIEHASVMSEGEVLHPADLPGQLLKDVPMDTAGLREADSTAGAFQTLAGSDLSLDEIEKRLLLRVLDETGGNRTQAAKRLGITRRTLGYRLEKHGIELS
jgi:DNA-binding NtrC family response regulator